MGGKIAKRYLNAKSGYKDTITQREYIMAEFEGVTYRLADNWFDFIPVDATKPLQYAEVGTFYGANLLSVAKTYGAHPQSRLIAIDPYLDYADYPEYIGQQDGIYQTFLGNVARSGEQNKITVQRGFSHEQLPLLADSAFDIIYIDGNHEPEYVLEDAVLAFRKVKVGGYMVFDDYGWGGPDLTQRGIDAFLSGYHGRIERLGVKKTQVFVRKVR